MNSFFSNQLNSTLLEYINISWGTFCDYFLNTLLVISDEESSKAAIIFESLWDLKTYFIIILLNFVLIFIAWRIYNKRIEDQFMKPASIKAIEELKASVSKLKLPKEHSPRI